MIKFLKGLIIGISFTIPGVCSALTAMLLSVYNELLEIIESFYKPRILLKNLCFILGIIIWICLSIIIISFLFNSYEKYLTIYFFGLSIGGAILLIKKNRGLDFKGIVVLFTGLVLSILPSLLNMSSNNNGNLFFISIGGFLSSLAFIMPGISGSMLLLTLGIYEKIISSISMILKMFVVGIDYSSLLICMVFIISFIVGTIFFARIIGKVINNYEKIFIEFCIGLLIGTIAILFFNVYMCDIRIYFKILFCILGIATIKFLG